VKAKLDANSQKLWSLNEMEKTRGEPDLVGHDEKTGEYIFNDCSAASPTGREVFFTTMKRKNREKNSNKS
jgi:hypothetical protein